MGVSIQQAREAKAELARRLADARGLVGIGITRAGKDYAVKVNFSAPPAQAIPEVLGGVPVRVEVTGRIRKRGRGAR